MRRHGKFDVHGSGLPPVAVSWCRDQNVTSLIHISVKHLKNDDIAVWISTASHPPGRNSTIITEARKALSP